MSAKIPFANWVNFYMAEHLEYATPRFHFEIYWMLAHKKRISLAAPRFFSKSTIVAFFYSIYSALEEGVDDIMIVSSTEPLASHWLMRIREEIEKNNILREDYGVEIPKKADSSLRWGSKVLRFRTSKGTITITAKGRQFQVRGFHPKLLIVDDLEQDEELLNMDMREKLRSWFDRSLIKMLRSTNQCIVIGTIIHPKSLLADLVKRKGWFGRVYRALDKKDKSIWEAAFSTTELKLERELDFYGFMSERMNMPMTSRSKIIRPEWIKKAPEKLPKIVEAYMAVDPALSEKKTKSHSATGVVVLGIGEDKNIYELHSEEGMWSSTDVLANSIAISQTTTPRPAYLGIESYSYQKMLYQLATTVAKGINWIELIQVGKGKIERARPTTHLFQRGMVYLRNERLIDQLRMFPDGDGTDMCDALFWALKMIMDYSTIWFETKEKVETEEDRMKQAILDRVRHRIAERNGTRVRDMFLGSY